MSAESDWGNSDTSGPCPFCTELPPINDHSMHVADLPVSSWRLTLDQGNRGASLLIFRPRHAQTLQDLSPGELFLFTRDLQEVDRALQCVCQPQHMNYALLGNVVRHLHWHLIPRYRDEPRWGMPVWTSRRAEMVRAYPGQAELQALAELLRASLPDCAN